jgi:CRP-like cAMP-binding protein/ATP/ADP translocase/HEAT repeat protein
MIAWKSEDSGELKKALLLLAYLFFVTAASAIGRTAADTLFLSNFDNSALSAMYLPQAIVMIVAGILFQRYVHKVRLHYLILALIPSISLLVLLSRIGVGLELRWVLPVIYIGYDVFNFLMIVCFWQFATSVMDQRKAKRMIGIVGSGGIVGGILSGFGIRLAAPLIGTPNLIYAYALFQLLALGIFLLLLRQNSPSSSGASAGQSSGAQDKRHSSGLFRNVPHLKYMAILSASLVLALTLIDYQFKAILRDTLQNDELAGFMGTFLGFSGLIALLVQLLVSGRVMAKFGVITALLIFPIVLATGSFGLLALPVLGMAVVLKGSDKVVGDTLYASVSQFIMFPIRQEWRAKAKGFMDGIVRNGAKGLAAVCLLVFTQLLAVEQLSYIVLMLLGASIFAAFKVKKAYLSTLMESLRSGGTSLEKSELNFMDMASLRVLTDSLASPDPRQALYALSILRGLDFFDLAEQLPRLLQHSSTEVRAAALADIARLTPPELETMTRSMIHSPDAQVKTQALLALAAYGREEDLDMLTQHLDAPDTDVQTAAIAALIKYYGVEGMFRAVGKLKQLLDSSLEEERMSIASLFGTIGIQSFYKPLLALLQDDSPRVVVRALHAAATLRAPQLVPAILPALLDSHTRRHAVDALAAYEDDAILDRLKPYLADKELALPLYQVYEQIGTQQSFDLLTAVYADADYDRKDRILDSLIRMNKQRFDVRRSDAERFIHAEIELYAQLAEHAAAIPHTADAEQVLQILDELRSRAARRVFGWLMLLEDDRTIRMISHNWQEGDGARQANAAEALDQLLQGSLRTAMAAMMAAPRTIVRSTRRTEETEASMQWLLNQPDAWLVDNLRYLTRPHESYGHMKEHMDRVTALKHVPLLQSLSSRELSIIATRLKAIAYEAGSVLIREGELGNSMLIVHRGRVAVDQGERRLNELGPYECVGEMALLREGIRMATIRALESVQVWELRSSDFYDMMMNQPGIAVEMMKLLSRRLRLALARGEVNPDAAAERGPSRLQSTSTELAHTDEAIIRRVIVLQQIELFADLSLDEIVQLARAVDEAEYEPGESICREGEFGDSMYGIIEGDVKVHKGADAIARLSGGECFGEMAIIDSGPRSADCTAITRTLLLRLHKDQVLAFCFQNVEILQRFMRVLANRLHGLQSAEMAAAASDER